MGIQIDFCASRKVIVMSDFNLTSFVWSQEGFVDGYVPPVGCMLLSIFWASGFPSGFENQQ